MIKFPFVVVFSYKPEDNVTALSPINHGVIWAQTAAQAKLIVASRDYRGVNEHFVTLRMAATELPT